MATSKKAKSKAVAKAAGAPAPAAPSAVFVSKTKPERRVRPAEVEIEAREKIIVEAKKQIEALHHPFQEFPKMVKGLTVDTPEQEKAVLDGSAVIEEVQSAAGSQRTVK
jgi:hypothetical protein